MPTIDYAIDLGTTNSCLAVWEEGKVMVIRNPAGEEYTPSAVYRRQLREGVLQRVGRPARNLLASQESQADEEGATDEFFGPVALEFKRRMGESGWRHRFSGGGEASAVELSAEVLKELLNGVQQWRGTKPRAAVITCPAYFEQPQWDATREAGLVAGLKYVELLEEPVAASYAYGLDAQVAGSARWLVFDLGGGTFDCALVGVADDMLRILDHAGDNRLGGKDIDEAIVDRHLLPRLPEAVKQRTRRNRGSNWWRLKFAAEEAKIKLATVTEREYILIDRLSGAPDFALECSLSREQLQAIEEEIIARAVAICRELLARHQFELQHIDRLLLVGGPTLSPYLRERLAEELGIPLDTSLDPMTAVARGAAAYARTRLWEPGGKDLPSGAISVNLEYPPQTQDKNPLVTGRLSVDPATGWQIEVERRDSNGQRLWSSGQQAVSAKGAFSLRLPLEPGENHLRLSVFNPQRQMVPVAGGEFDITVGGISTEPPPLPRGIGVITDTGEVDWLFEVGERVAGRITRTHKHVTTKPLRRGESGEVLSIPLVEGREREGYLNRHIGTLELRAQDAPRDLPPGSRVDITIELQSASREYRAWGWVDAWEREIPAIMLTSTDVDLSALRDELEELREAAQRLAPVAEEDSTVRIAYTEATERLLPEAERLLAAAGPDPDSGQRAEEQVRKLKKVIYPAVRHIDDRNLWSWVKVKKDCEENVRRAKDILDQAEPEARRKVQAEFDRLLADYEAALGRKDWEAAESLAFGKIPDLLIRNGLAEGTVRDPSAQPGVPVLSTQRGDTRPM